MMNNNKKDKTLFNKDEQKYLPLTYRQMTMEKTESIGELHLKSKFSQSCKHFSKKYLFFVSYKPISNFLIEEDAKDR